MNSTGGGRTIVSVEFDDGAADQLAARQILGVYGLTATFFVSSGRIGSEGCLEWRDLEDLAADGHEVGGHTLDHVNLTRLERSEQRRQVLQDREELLAHGFSAESFAYPFGKIDKGAEDAVRDAGYLSGRGIHGVVSANSCPLCPPAETLPPANRLVTRAPADVRSRTSIGAIKRYVTRAEEAGGGWVQVVFHHIGHGHEPYTVSRNVLDDLLHWLSTRPTGTTVMTVAAAIRSADSPRPSVAAPTPSATCRLLCRTLQLGREAWYRTTR